MLTATTVQQIETTIEASPAPGMTLDELVVRLTELGNPILSIDREHNIVRVAHHIKDFS